MVESSTSDSVLENEKGDQISDDTIMNHERIVDSLIVKTGINQIKELKNNKLQILSKDDKISVDDDDDSVKSNIEERKEKYIDNKIQKEEGRGGKENIIRESQGSNNPENEFRTVDNNNLSEVYNKVPEKELNVEKNETRCPVIRSIETVEFNLPLKKQPATYSAKLIDQKETMSRLNNQGDFLGTEFNWKRGNRTDSLYTLADSRKG